MIHNGKTIYIITYLSDDGSGGYEVPARAGQFDRLYSADSNLFPFPGLDPGVVPG
jgi:hypothetical protein